MEGEGSESAAQLDASSARSCHRPDDCSIFFLGGGIETVKYLHGRGGRGRTSVSGISGSSTPTRCGGERQAAPPPIPANAEAPLAVTGSGTRGVRKPVQFSAADIGGKALDGVASELPATVHRLVPSM